MATRAEQADQMQAELMRVAQYVDDRAENLKNWLSQTAATGHIIAPETSAAVGETERALSNAAAKIRSAARDLEPFTTEASSGTFADVV